MKPVDTLRNSHVQLVPLKWLNTYEHVVSMPRTKFQSLDMLPQELVQMVDAVYAEDWALYQAVRCKRVTRNPHEFVKIVHVCIHSILRLSSNRQFILSSHRRSSLHCSTICFFIVDPQNSIV
jgi:hypothetical protein